MKNQVLTRIALTMLAIGLLLAAFFAGTRFAQPANQPLVVNTKLNNALVPTVEARVVATNTVQYVEKPVTEVKYVMNTVTTELKNFTALEELRQWLVEKNGTTVQFQAPGAVTDCDDYALELQQKALADGFLVTFQIIEPATYNALFQMAKIDTLHAIDLTIIGNNAYYIEPQTGEIVLAAQLD